MKQMIQETSSVQRRVRHYKVMGDLEFRGGEGRGRRTQNTTSDKSAREHGT